MALVVHADGRCEDYDIENDAAKHLEALQTFVGGSYELVRVCRGLCAYVNGMGSLINLPFNEHATAIVNNMGKKIFLVGSVVFLDDDKALSKSMRMQLDAMLDILQNHHKFILA